MLSLLESDSDLKKPESKLSTDPELSVSWVMLSWELIQHERVQVCSVYCVECALYIGYYYAQRDNGTWEKIYWILRGNNNFNCVNPEIYVQFCLIKRKKIDIFGTFRRAGHNPHPLIHLEGGGGSIYIVYIYIYNNNKNTPGMDEGEWSEGDEGRMNLLLDEVASSRPCRSNESSSVRSICHPFYWLFMLGVKESER